MGTCVNHFCTTYIDVHVLYFTQGIICTPGKDKSLLYLLLHVMTCTSAFVLHYCKKKYPNRNDLPKQDPTFVKAIPDNHLCIFDTLRCHCTLKFQLLKYQFFTCTICSIGCMKCHRALGTIGREKQNTPSMPYRLDHIF